jgi:histidinol-phosphate aminotransferase
MQLMPLLPRPGILDISPYVGGEFSAPGLNRVIRLASNENPLGPSPRAVEAYVAAKHDLHRYPDGGAQELRDAIAAAQGLDPTALVCGAGSDELIALLARAYAGPEEVLFSEHGFLMFPIAAKAAGATPVAAPERDLTADVDALLARVTAYTRIVFLANPNNPTGSYLPAHELRRLREGLPAHVVLVIDAAYAEYVTADDYDPGASLVRESDNVVMTRTFSKIHGLAALRLGWAYCPAEVADVLHRVRGPFNVSHPAQAAGIAALKDAEHVERSRRHNARTLSWFSEKVGRTGLRPYPSIGNFVLVCFPNEPPRSAAAAAQFLKDRGILVRQMGAYRLPDCLRITIGTEEEMETVSEALAEFAA